MNQWNVRKVLNIAHLSIPKRRLKRGDGDGDGRERKDIRVVKYPWKEHQFFLMEDACLDVWKGVYKVLDPFFCLQDAPFSNFGRVLHFLVRYPQTQHPFRLTCLSIHVQS